MLIRENELRLSEEFQKLYEEAEKDSNSERSWLDVTEELQRRVITEFQLDEQMDEALLCLRCSTEIFPELKSIPIYVRFNRARDGDLKVGDFIPNVDLVKINGEKTNLFENLDEKPTLLISGSFSWPPLRKIVGNLNELFILHKSSINFIFVYILEAHGEDEWPIRSGRWTPNGEPVRYDQTRTIEQRIKVAKDFIRNFQIQMTMLIDEPSKKSIWTNFCSVASPNLFHWHESFVDL